MLIAPLLALALLPTIWVVDAANGPGTNFTDLPAAVAAAATGDTILVRSGNYSAFVVTGKSLTIRGGGQATTNVNGPAPAGSAYSTTTIDNVPFGSPFYIDGLAFSAPNGPGVRILGPTTVVALADVSAVGGIAVTLIAGGPGLSISGGARVHAARCHFIGWGCCGAPVQNAAPGALVSTGSVLVADATRFGGGGASMFLPAVTAGSGVEIQGGFVTLSRCSAFGGWSGQPAGHGVKAVAGSFVRIAGTPQNVIRGGLGSSAPFHGYAVFADASSVIVNGPVSLQPGGPGGALTYGAVTTGGVPLPYVSVIGTTTPAGEIMANQPATAMFDGTIAFAPFAYVVDLAPGFSTALAPATVGPLLVQFPLGTLIQGTLDVSGLFQVTFTAAVDVPFLTDVPVYAQFGVLDTATGQVRLSNGNIQVYKN